MIGFGPRSIMEDTLVANTKTPFPIPDEVVSWIRSVFEQINNRVAYKLGRIPTVHETSLDMTFIEQVSQYSAPFMFPSDWIVRLETHFLGGGRHWGPWEIADIGVLVAFRSKHQIVGTKIALLQSKRLYPEESEVPSEDHPLDYATGFGRLLQAEQEFKSSIKKRHFHFTQDSRYRALEYADTQYSQILDYIKVNSIPVHYLFYHPPQVPSDTWLPAEAEQKTTSPPRCEVGCRVIHAHALDTRLGAAKLKKRQNPSYAEAIGTLQDRARLSPWTLQHFIADLVIGCKEGYIGGLNPMQDAGLQRVFFERAGPISAAISITIDSPFAG